MVNTFIPFKDFKKCAEVLDDKRLYKQIVECKQILNAIDANNKNEKYGYQNHPIVKMWQLYPNALRYYQWCMFKEWAKRRWKFDIYEYDYSECNGNEEYGYDIEELSLFYFELPKWLNNEELLISHRLNLLYKFPEHYSQYFKESVPPDKPDYIWITNE